MQTSRTFSLVTVFAALMVAPSLTWAAGEVGAVEKAKLSLTDAIMAAEKTSGGTATEAEITTKDNMPIWSITVLKGEKTAHYTVDASGSTAQAVESKGLIDKMDREGDDERAAARDAKVSLKEAVKTVEGQTGGKVVDAELEGDGKKIQYDFQVALNGEKVKKSVDGATGKVIASK